VRAPVHLLDAPRRRPPPWPLGCRHRGCGSGEIAGG
jgi:hypothetical protein